MSYGKNLIKSHLNNLHQGKIKWHGRKLKFFYSCPKSEFDYLLGEVFRVEVYKEGIRNRKEMVVVDAGAYIGDTALYFAKWAKKIYCLEPNFLAFHLLKKNIKVNKMKDKVIALNYALADNTGKGRLCSGNVKDYGSTLIQFNPGLKGFEVKTISLEDLIKKFNIPKIDLLKMDIEGSEYEIIEGESLARVADKIDSIILEVHPYNLPGERDSTVWKIPYKLRQYGFVTKEVIAEHDSVAILRYTDGSKKQVKMPMFIAIKRNLL